MIETLFLDAGGVLVFPNWQRVSAALATHGVNLDAQILASAEPMAKRRLDEPSNIHGSTDARRGWQYFNLILLEAGVPLSDATDAALADLHAYHDDHNLWEFVPPDVQPALERLRALGLKLVVVSNANGRLRRLFDRVGLSDRVDVLIDSFDEGVEKPDPRLFQIALERSGSRRETTMHVGDIYHVDVVGARSAGLQAVLLDAARLYEGVECPRIHSLADLCDLLAKT
ncbi:MAG TPA: HAD-IA family hydrolase [Vicinamibacterales bacterium]|jgi:HAD superfamily hydrolase (TIGR01549 family)